ncbi:hypothetical protein D3C72_977530 [compost metagenome]
MAGTIRPGLAAAFAMNSTAGLPAVAGDNPRTASLRALPAACAAFCNAHRHHPLALGCRCPPARLEDHSVDRRCTRRIALFPTGATPAQRVPGHSVWPGLRAGGGAGRHVLRGVGHRPGVIGFRGGPHRRAARAVVRAGVLCVVGRVDRLGQRLPHADGGGHCGRHRQFGVPSGRLFHHQPPHYAVPPGARVFGARSDRQPGLGVDADIHDHDHLAGRLARGRLQRRGAGGGGAGADRAGRPSAWRPNAAGRRRQG